MKQLPSVALAALLLAWAPLAALANTTAPLQPSDFAWHAPLQTPANAPLLRVELPAAALGALQSRAHKDLRIFDAQGQALPFAVLPVPAASPQDTQGPSIRALPMATPTPTAGNALVARVEVRSEGQGKVQHMQVQWDAPSGTRSSPGLQAALFDLRNVKGLVHALDVDIALPENTPVHLQASLSKTLQQWQNLPTAGPLYQFAGTDAPRNTRLQLTGAQAVHGHFLLLQWPANTPVQVHALRARTVVGAPAPSLVEMKLPPGELARDGKGLEWALPPGAQLQSVQWSLPQPNQLRTLQLQGRRASSASNAASKAWEPLGTVLVYHLVQNGEVRHSPAHTLPPGDWHTLRLSDWPSGEAPPANALQATLQLQPITLAFLANDQAPYTLAVGHRDAPFAALPAATLAAAAATPQASWPLAAIGLATTAPQQAPRLTDRWRDFVQDSQARTGFLWLVLAAAVLVLGTVALKLLRSTQNTAQAPLPPATPSQG